MVNWKKIGSRILPDDPNVNRVRGDGCQSIFEFVWRKGLVGGFFLLLLISPGVYLLKDEINKMRIN